MRSWKKLLKTKKLFLGSFLFLAFISCDRESEVKEVIVARVGDSVLTENRMNQFLGDKSGIAKSRDEYIRQWLETELLFQIAMEDNLLSEDNFFKIMNSSSKELAANIALSDYLEKQKIDFSRNKLKRYYETNKEDYLFYEDAFLLNLIRFNDESSAIAFRNRAIREGWEKALEIFSNDTSFLSDERKRIYKQSEIQSKLISRVLGKLYDDEISVVINTELNDFVIVQYLDKIEMNSIPIFDYVIDDVRNAFVIEEKKKQAKSFIDSLMMQQRVKIY
jgi:hypothetical protein